MGEAGGVVQTIEVPTVGDTPAGVGVGSGGPSAMLSCDIAKNASLQFALGGIKDVC